MKEIRVKVLSEGRSYKQKQKLASYKKIIKTEEYLNIADEVLKGNYTFKFPQKLVVNKLQTAKKEKVYLFDFQDDLLLKMINRILT